MSTHGLTVLRVCRAVVGRDEADDVRSETFIAALRAYPNLDPGANVEAVETTEWLHARLAGLAA